MNKLFYVFIPVCLLIATWFFVFYPISNFPRPKGPYGVGQIKYHWVDVSRKELNAQDKEHPYREIMAYVFYPTNKNESESPIAFDADAAKVTTEFLAQLCNLPEWLFSSIKSIKTYAHPNAQIIQSDTKLPVIIFSHGGGPMIQSYTYMLEELASHGFVVVGINHPYVAAIVRYPDGRIIKSIMKQKSREAKNDRQLYLKWKLDQIETNAQDVSFAINRIEELVAQNDKFWSLIDLNNIGMMGQSFGGRTTVRVLRKDKRIRCGINLDGCWQDEDIQDAPEQQLLFMGAEKSHLWNPNNPHYPAQEKPNLDKIKRLAETKNSNLKIMIIEGIGHAVFCDMPLQLNMTLCSRFISRFADFYLEVPVGVAIDILTNNILPKIIDFFENQMKSSATKTELAHF